MFAHHAVPRADPFSFSMPGAPWTAHEWLSEISLTLAFHISGWSGVVLLTAAAATGAALVVGLRAVQDLDGALLVVVLTLGVGLWLPTLLARPHVLALPVAAAWFEGLLGARDRDSAPPLALALLMTLWANLHGSFVFGLALVATFALEAVAAAPGSGRHAAARGWGVFAAAALAAALCNPFGAEALAFPFRLMSVEYLARKRMAGPGLQPRRPDGNCAARNSLAFPLVRPVRMPPIRVALLIGLVAMALQHVRHAMILGPFGPMLLARPISIAIGAEQTPSGGRIRPAWRLSSA